MVHSSATVAQPAPAIQSSLPIQAPTQKPGDVRREAHGERQADRPSEAWHAGEADQVAGDGVFPAFGLDALQRRHDAQRPGAEEGIAEPRDRRRAERRTDQQAAPTARSAAAVTRGVGEWERGGRQ